MPDDIREAAEQAKHTGNTKGLYNFSDNYKEYGIVGESGNVFEINDDGDVIPSTPAAASGISLGDDDTVTDKCGGKAVSEWMSRCVSETGSNSDGTMSFSALPSKEEYIRQNTASEEEYLDAGNRIAAAERKKDEGIVSRYENSMPESRQLRFSAEKAEKQLEKLDSKAVLIDLASADGGADKQAVERLGKRYIHALAIPGKYAPGSSGKIIADTVRNIITERRENDDL